MDKKQMEYQNDYISQKYDRINVTIPKGMKEKYKQQAAAEGKSLNKIINELLQHWAEDPTEPAPEPTPEEATKSTRLNTLHFLSKTSIAKLEVMGIYTIGEYAERYYDDDPDDQLTYDEEDELDSIMTKYNLW